MMAVQLLRHDIASMVAQARQGAGLALAALLVLLLLQVVLPALGGLDTPVGLQRRGYPLLRPCPCLGVCGLLSSRRLGLGLRTTPSV